MIGVGNSFRRDDGVGLAIADEVAKRRVPGLEVVAATGEPGALLDVWTGAELAVVVDAAMAADPHPGRIRRWTPGQDEIRSAVSSHAVGIPQAHALGEALHQLPDRLVVLSVDISDADYGTGFTTAVEAAIPAVVDAVLAEFRGARSTVRGDDDVPG